jgi:hypothetical protein
MSAPTREPSRLVRALLVPVLAVTSVLGTSVGTTAASFTSGATATSTIATRSACGSGSAYAALLSSPAWSPTVWWRFANVTGNPVVADASGHGNNGTASGSGLSFGTANAGMVMCDGTYAMRTTGAAAATGTVSLATARTAPTTFTLATWVRSNARTGGRLLGFGNLPTGASTTRDRALLLDRSGRVVLQLGQGTGNLLLTSPGVVADNRIHLVVASVTPAGATLYVDGVQVAAAVPAQALPTYTGYWRAGYEAGANQIIAGSRNQANARQDEVAIWEGRALTAADVATLFAANHW